MHTFQLSNIKFNNFHTTVKLKCSIRSCTYMYISVHVYIHVHIYTSVLVPENVISCPDPQLELQQEIGGTTAIVSLVKGQKIYCVSRWSVKWERTYNVYTCITDLDLIINYSSAHYHRTEASVHTCIYMYMYPCTCIHSIHVVHVYVYCIIICNVDSD